MGNVNILPQDIVSKIAAGEVIERPASCVKELIENSLDAGARSIELHLKDSGKTLIHIKDNGTGIAPDDIEKIFLRHSTSKLKTIDDLYAIHSLGFRGEALYSIASIADVILRSKTETADSGWEIHMRGGKRILLRPYPMANGTEMEIKELFFNTPARRKFLKSDSAELTQILNTFIPYTLLYPDRRFLLTHHEKPLIDLPEEHDSVKRLARALHLKEEHIIEAYKKSDDGTVSVRLFLGDINIQRPKKDMQFIFINSRPVFDKIVSFHLNQVYRLVMPPEVTPFFAVFIEMPAENIDVNMHPTKREVKIKNDRELVHLIRPLCEHSLMSQGTIKKADDPWVIPPRTSAPSEPVPMAGDNLQKQAAAEEPHRQYTLFTGTGEPSAINLENTLSKNKKENFKSKLSNSRFIGNFARKYLFFEAGTSLLLIDQHAAQERITYEKLCRQIDIGAIETQKLLSPVVIRLSHQEMLALEEAKEKIEKVGFEITQWDKESIAIHSHPQLISLPEISVRTILAGDNAGRASTETIARWACRSSVMAGDDVKKEGAENIRQNLLKCKDPFTCPHGRPTVVELDEKFLNRQFYRS
ncbi:MAG: DNA mismatch repair endonuclease MutL [Candidatus Omnitrophica bacterium]|nr:DNA mismatch repair endonuclease MutL [Candidatus Omnitrophota bacterium]